MNYLKQKLEKMDAGFGRYGQEMQDGEEDVVVTVNGLRKGPWTDEEDALLFDYVSLHGEGRWNSVAVNTGLKRTGKSCRLRWLNYLRPDLRRGNITLEEQLLILELHSRWGSRWSKIAKHIPGRTDNEIKNYWRTRVQKQAKHLKCDVNSQKFRDMTRDVFIPRLMEKIRALKADAADYTESDDLTKDQITGDVLAREPSVGGISSVSWDSQVSPTSGLTESDYSTSGYEHNEDNHNIFVELGTWTNIDAQQASEAQFIDQSGNNFWLDGGNGRSLDIQAWKEESLRFLRQHLLEEDY